MAHIFYDGLGCVFLNIFLVPYVVPSDGAFNVCKSSHDTCCCFLALGTISINSDGAGTPHLLSLALTLLLSHTHTHADTSQALLSLVPTQCLDQHMLTDV